MKSLEALRAAPGLRIGSQAIGHSNYFVGRLFAWLIGLKQPNFLVGYSGNEQDLALGRGELDARINNADTLTRRNADLLAKNLVNVHAIKVFQDPEFQKDYLKLVGEAPTPVMPEDMERLVKDLARDPEIVALFKKINDAGPVPLR